MEQTHKKELYYYSHSSFRPSRINKKGNHRLRKALYMPAVSAIRHNKVIKEFYNRLLDRGKIKMVALTAAMRKLLTIAIAVLNNQTAFDYEWSKKYYELKKA